MAHRKKSNGSKAKTTLRLPDLEQSKNSLLHSLAAASSQESYGHAIDEFIGWYCSEPRLAFNRTVVLRYRFFLEQKNLAPSTINVRLAAVRRLAYEASDTGLLSPELARYMEPGRLQGLIDQISTQLAAEGKGPFKWKTVPQGAATSVLTAVVAPADDIAGRYCENCHVGKIVPDSVTITGVSEGVPAYALDPANAEALWKKSEEMVGETF